MKIKPSSPEKESRYHWWPTNVVETKERLDMSKKHYEMLADVIHNSFSFPDESDFVQELMDVLKADNPRFNREKFLAACRGE